MTMLISPKKPMFLFCVPVCISIKIFIFKTRISRNHCNCYCKSASRSSGVHGLQPAQLLCPWGFFQASILEWEAMPSSRGIFLTQRSNSGLPHCRWILYQPSHKGSPRILERVAYPFSRGFSRPRN